MWISLAVCLMHLLAVLCPASLVLTGGNGQTSLNDYDALGRLKARTLFKTATMSGGGEVVLAEFNWDHDSLGNVLAQHETWPGDATRHGGIRSTVMEYDDNNRLLSETIQTRTSGTAAAVDQSRTEYTYDDANNRASKTVTRIAAAASSAEAGESEVGHWEYGYNVANQLTGWEKWDEEGGSLQKSATLSYDDAGNRTGQVVDHIGSSAADETTAYTWDAQDRLLGVTLPDGSEHAYEYDYRTRRIGTSSTSTGAAPVTKQTAVVFSGGLSVAEWESETGSLPVAPTVEYTRGPDMGGGVGGLLYSLRGESGAVTAKYNLSNGRGDIVAQSNQSAALTWTASYEAYGKRTKETGTNQDKQRGNSKDEDPTGLLNEGFRYRDLETGVWLSRDPAGFVDGPNLYAYVRQNPWTGFDPRGLALADITGEKRNRSSSKHLEELDGIVTKASDNLEKRGFVPSNPSNPGEFGTALHDEVSSITSSQKNIHSSVVVKEVKGFWGSDWEVVSVGKGAGPKGTTEIDLMKTADGYTPKAGQMLDRKQVLAALEVKSSVEALKSMDFSPGGQGARLNKIFSSDKLAASVPDRNWTAQGGWKFNKLAAAGTALMAWGMFSQVHAIQNIDRYNDQFDDVMNSAGAYRASVENGASHHELFINHTQFVRDSHTYMSNFTDSTAQGIVTEVQLRAGISKHFGK